MDWDNRFNYGIYLSYAIVGIKQSATYYPNFEIKTYSEVMDGVEVLYSEYDTNGYLTYERYSTGKWAKFRYNLSGMLIFHETNEGNQYDWTRVK